MFMTQNDDDPFTALAEPGQTTAYQFAANMAALMVRENCHRSQRNGGYRRLRCFHCHSAEQDMADDLALIFRDKRQQNGLLGSQPVDQRSFIGAAKSGLVHVPNLLQVARLLVSDDPG